MSAQIIQGHVLDVLRSFEAGRFQCAVTSPPYFNLRVYHTEGQVWGGEADCEHEWEELEARLSGGGRSDKTTLRRSGTKHLALRNAKGLVATCRLCGAWRGELGAEPEPDLYVAHLLEITAEIQRVLRDDGVFWLNMGDSFSGSGKGVCADGKQYHTKYRAVEGSYQAKTQPDSVPAKSLCLIPERVRLAMAGQGWILRNKVVWHKKNAMPTSANDRFKCCHEGVDLWVKQQKYKFRLERVKVPAAPDSVARVHRGTNLQRGDRPYAIVSPGGSGTKPMHWAEDDADGLVNPGDVWQIASQPRKENHFAAFPDALVKRCLLASTDEGDEVLDPFVGRGTTCIQAAMLGRPSVGIELNADYAAMAEKNIAEMPVVGRLTEA